ncbi:RNA polymerase II-associated factor 1 homolog [Camellia sinensis]|uniref:RNA polymerase II-associated factor 1 homolog n=1 Tax=Camellia sinensis TaxID=4442 RepID=UPI001036DEDD|nr:RNA polymerase II-associated factor 1 homolog [Camellia sinensis]
MLTANIDHLNAFASIYRVHMRCPRADSVIDGDGADEEDTARPPRYPRKFFNLHSRYQIFTDTLTLTFQPKTSQTIPPMSMAPAVAAAPALAVPPPAARRRERQAPARCRGRARGTRDESDPSESILSDDDVETSDSEEAASQHSKSSESGNDVGSGSENRGDDAEEGSGAESEDDASSSSGSESASDNGADGDSAPESSPPGKRTKRASRA